MEIGITKCNDELTGESLFIKFIIGDKQYSLEVFMGELEQEDDVECILSSIHGKGGIMGSLNECVIEMNKLLSGDGYGDDDLAVILINDKFSIVTRQVAFELKEHGAYILLQSDKEICEAFIQKVNDLNDVIQ